MDSHRRSLTVSNDRSWFAVDGSLEPIDYPGASFFRFPEAVAEFAIQRYSDPGDWVFDPFAGFGTTVLVAERLGRHGVGCEADASRARFAAGRVSEGRVVHGRAETISSLSLPPFNLLFTSPPYGSFRNGDVDDEPVTYLADAGRLFRGFLPLLAPRALVVVEVSQIRRGMRTRPLVWELGSVLGEFLDLREDIVRVNTGTVEAGPGYDHSHLLVFSPRGAPDTEPSSCVRLDGEEVDGWISD
jgi:hypothetical protein